MTAPAPLAWSQLDQDLLVWGVAVLFDLGIYQVISHKGDREAAEIAAGSTNVYATTPDDVATVVFHHPDTGWTCPVTGRTFRTL
jgi:hypothetical protein